jgi:transcriptional regulator with XRE-family HTH domain
LAGELRRRREEAGLSKNRLAERAGLSQQMVSYVEKSVCIPTTATLYRLAEALGTTPGVILTAIESGPAKTRGKTPAPAQPGEPLAETARRAPKAVRPPQPAAQKRPPPETGRAKA